MKLSQIKELRMRLSAGEHDVSGLVLDANLTFSRLEIIAASDAFVSSNGPTLLEVHAGAPPVKLQGLNFTNGRVIIEGGTVEIADCRFVRPLVQARVRRRLKAGTDVRALLVSGGYVSISDTVFEDLLDGAIEVSNGSLAVHTSVFQNNEAESGGALLVTGGKVVVGSSTFTDNKARMIKDDQGGGAIRITGSGTTLELADKTVITGSKDHGGSVASDVEWTYVLPAPLAHYVSDPDGRTRYGTVGDEQEGIARNEAGVYAYDLPIPCAATLYGIVHHIHVGPLSDPSPTWLYPRPYSPALGPARSHAL